ncbi:MAG: RNA polymerase sigma factor [Acidimicrobiales bacterium]
MTADGSLGLSNPPLARAKGESAAEVISPDETFEDVFRREHEAMVRLAYLLVNSRPVAEEAVQDAFARLLDRFDSVDNPGGFVRTVTVNRCRDLVRRQRRERRFLSRFRLAESPSPVPSSVEMASGDLDDVLAGLDRRRREVVVLRFYLGHSHKEIAAILGMREPTVRTTLHRALSDLRVALEGEQS